MRRPSFPLSLLATATLVVSLTACRGGDDGSVVARAANQRWTVEEAASLITPRHDLPAQPTVVQTLANLWIDYTLLATAAAEDSNMTQVDVTGVVNELADDRLLRALRDSVVHLAPMTPAQFDARYASEAPNSFVHARQILLAWPAGATATQKDSVRRAAADLRQQLAGSRQEFANVARTRSQDPATAPRGGDMGLVGKGQLVPSLDKAVFSLSPGEISQPIESPYGVHLLEVEQRVTPSREQFRIEATNRDAARAESTFIAGLERQSAPHLEADAPSIVRKLAQNPRLELGRMEDIKALVTYKDGEVTEGEALRQLQKEPPAMRSQIAQAQDDSIPARYLMSLTRRELLLAEAERRGFRIRPEVRNELILAARRNLKEAARQLSLMPVAGRNPTQAIPESVSNLLTGMLTGQRREVTPLGPMSYALRARYPASTFAKGVDAAVARIEQGRRSADAGPAVRR
jgi:hypothetical protein